MIAKLGHRTNVRYGTHADMSPLPIVRPLLFARNQGSKNALWPYCERSRERMLSYGSISGAGESVLHSAGEKRARRAPPPPSVFDDPFSRFSRHVLELCENVPRLPEGRTAPKWRLPGLFPGCVTSTLRILCRIAERLRESFHEGGWNFYTVRRMPGH